MTLTPTPKATHWVRVCTLNDILPDTGVCALIDTAQVAVFRLRSGGAEQLFAVGNHDPFTGANVLSRGLTGSYTTPAGEVRFKVASPLLKHAFDLASGQSLDDPSVTVTTYAVRSEGGEVWIGLTA